MYQSRRERVIDLLQYEDMELSPSLFPFSVVVESDSARYRPKLVSVDYVRRALCNPMNWLIQSFYPDVPSDAMVDKWVAYWSAFKAMRVNSPNGGSIMLEYSPNPDEYVLAQYHAWESMQKRLQDISFFVRGSVDGEWCVRLRLVNDYLSLVSTFLTMSVAPDVDDEVAIESLLLSRLSKAWSRLSKPERVVVLSRQEFWELPEQAQPVLSSRVLRRSRPTKAIRTRKKDWDRVLPRSAGWIDEAVKTLLLSEYVYAAMDAGEKEFSRWQESVNEPDMLFNVVVSLNVFADSSHGDQEFIWNSWHPMNKFERIEVARRFLNGRSFKGSALWRKLTYYYRSQLLSWLESDVGYKADVKARGGKVDSSLNWHEPVFSFDGELLGHLPSSLRGCGRVPVSLMIPV